MRPRITATSLALLLILVAQLAFAAPAGHVTNLSGPLFAVGADGVRRVLSVGSAVEAGETLVTEGRTYAQVRFADQGVVTLKPDTHFKVESFAFDEKAPEKDGAVFGLLKGALRTVTGLIGKRGNQEAYSMKSATATIGIRGTEFLAQYVSPEEAGASTVSRVPYALPLLASLDARFTGRETLVDAPAGLFDLPDQQPIQLAAIPPSGLFVFTFQGSVSVFNSGGSLLVGSGQASFTPNTYTPPIIIPAPKNLINNFSPPTSFQAPPPGQQGPSGQPPPTPPNSPLPPGGCEMR
jgi:hypothetical protein